MMTEPVTYDELSEAYDRLRQQNHDAAHERDRRYAETESHLANLRNLMKMAMTYNDADAFGTGSAQMSAVSQAKIALLLQERDALQRQLAEAQAQLKFEESRDGKISTLREENERLKERVQELEAAQFLAIEAIEQSGRPTYAEGAELYDAALLALGKGGF